MYSQNNEEQIILDYFKDFKGHLLDIGANDGITLSNSRKLIELSWTGDLVEPSPNAFQKLKKLYSRKKKTKVHNIAIADKSETMTFYVSGEHLGNGDSDLLSTLSLKDKQKWESTTDYKTIEVQALTFKDFNTLNTKYDFINIDVEGLDVEVLKQLDLNELECKCLCIEHNGTNLNAINTEMSKYNFKVIGQNLENIIYAK
jgi:FkbM family methyltransferase